MNPTAIRSRFAAVGMMALAICPTWAYADAPGPIELSTAQMDGVTAGAMVVSVDAAALALGNPSLTDTNTFTKVWTSPNGRVEIGLGYGQAYACCGSNTVAQVSTSADADGKLVITRSGNVQIKTPVDVLARGFISIISVNGPAGRN
jgi:hypothetical protein